MAEKYGTVPEKFTKDWWEYFWMYYKWHTIAIIAIVLVIGTTIYSKVTEEKFDLTLTYAGAQSFSEEIAEKIEEKLSPLCEDTDKNGESNLCFTQLNVLAGDADPEYAMAMNAKLQMCFAEDETYIFILNDEIASAYAGESADECVFAPINDWLTEDTDSSSLFSAHGKNYGIALSDIEAFKELGIDIPDHYMFIRYYPRKDQQKRQLEGYKGAVKLANKLLK